MSASRSIRQYQSRLDRVVNYIYDHLDDDIDLNHLAEIACLSPYHWHRTYRGFKGETIKATVKRLRLHRAASQLVNTDMAIDKIVAQSGYSGMSAFSRAFATSYLMPPARYRATGKLSSFQSNIVQGEFGVHDQKKYEVELRDVGALNLVGLVHGGPYMEIGRAFEKLAVFGHEKGLFGPGTGSMALYFDDPDTVKTSELRSFAGMLEIRPTEIERPYERVVVEAGRFAVLRYNGPYSELPSVYNWFYGAWLPDADVEVRDAPCMEDYLNDPRRVAPNELLTDIFMPIK